MRRGFNEFAVPLIGFGLLVAALGFLFYQSAPSVRERTGNRRSLGDTIHQVAKGGTTANESGRPERPALSESQITERVRSLLHLKTGEIGIIAIPASDEANGSDPLAPDSMDDSSPLKLTPHSKESVEPILQSVLRQGGSLKSLISEPGQSRFSHDGSIVTVMKAVEGLPDGSEFVIQYQDSDLTVTRSVKLPKGKSLLIGRSDQAKDRLLLVEGN